MFFIVLFFTNLVQQNTLILDLCQRFQSLAFIRDKVEGEIPK